MLDPPARKVVFALITGYFRRSDADRTIWDPTALGSDWEVVIVDSVGRVRTCAQSGAGIEQEIQNWPIRVRLSPHYLSELNVVCEVLAGLEQRFWMEEDLAREQEAVEIAYRDGRSYRVGSALPVFNLFSRVLKPTR